MPSITIGVDTLESEIFLLWINFAHLLVSGPVVLVWSTLAKNVTVSIGDLEFDLGCPSNRVDFHLG